MTEWLTVLSVIIVGIIFLVLEILVIPGTTVVGILGLISVVAGVYFGFDYFGTKIGFMILSGSIVATGGVIYYVFTTRSIDKFTLKSAITSKVNQGSTDTLNIGQKGVSISTLKPIGKAEFDDVTYEVSSNGEYIEANSEIEIISINRNKIIVKLLK